MKSTAERVAAMRRRRYELGLTQIGFWVPKQHVEAIRELVKHEMARLAAPPPPPLTLGSIAEEFAAIPPEQGSPKSGRQRAVPWMILLSAPGTLPDGLKKRLRKAGFHCVNPTTWRGDAPVALIGTLLPAIRAAGARCEPGA